MIDIFNHELRVFLMKLRAKARFHCPPEFSLHHRTTLIESYSMTRQWFLMRSQHIEILIALRIAYTSARLISMLEIGPEKMHMNLPELFLRTLPTVARERRGSNEASTFYFKHPFKGGIQMEETVWDQWICLAVKSLTPRKQEGYARLPVMSTGKSHPNLWSTTISAWESNALLVLKSVAPRLC